MEQDMSITLCSVVFNEENRIADFIKNHRHKSIDEIIILDQSSTDNTAFIARSLGCKVIIGKCMGLAEPSRHVAALHASNEWILILDADEKASSELLDNIDTYINSGYTGYLLQRHNYIDGQYTTTEDNQYRLCNKKNVFFGTKLHDGIEPFGINTTGFIKDAIIHEKTSSEHNIDHEAYARIILHCPESINPFWYLVHQTNCLPINELITMVVTTSASHDNPDISGIQNLFDSYDRHFGTGPIRKILVADGFCEHRNINNLEYDKLGLLDENKYLLYKDRLREYCGNNNIIFHECGKHLWFDGCALEAMNRVSTPYYFITTNDIIAKRDIDLLKVIRGMASDPYIKRMYFHNYELHINQFSNILIKETVPFVYHKTSAFSSNTHVGYTHHFNYVWGPRIRALHKYPLEATIYKEYKELQNKIGFDSASRIYGLCVYGDMGEPRYVDHDFSYKKQIYGDDYTPS